MRKLLIILTAGTLLFTNCKKTDIRENVKSNSQEISSAKLDALQSMELEERKVAYRLLNESEKSLYWRSIVANFQSENKSLGKEALLLIKELQMRIKPEVFKFNSDENALFKDYFVVHWLDKAEKVLTSSNLSELAYKPGWRAQVKTTNLKTSPDISTSCACNLGSRFDCVKTSVHLGTDGISYTETHGACVNTSGGCQTSDIGCGFFWLYACNGSSYAF